jgi:hypothetical protein
MTSAFNRLSEPRKRVIVIYIAVTLTLTAISVLFWLTGFSDRHSFLMRFVFFDPGIPGSDIDLYRQLFSPTESGEHSFNLQGALSKFNYGPFSLFLVVLFLKLSHPSLFLGVFVGLAVLIAGFLFAKSLGNRLAVTAWLTALCTSYPFAFLFERGNIEGLLWVSYAAGIYCFVRRSYLAAALLIAVAASIKPFPGLLLVLLLPQRRYREFLIGIAASVTLTVGSLMIIGPSLSIAAREFVKGFTSFKEDHIGVYNSSKLGADHSLFALVKTLIRAAAGWPRQGHSLNEMVQAALPYYLLFAVLVIAVALYRLRTRPVLNQIFGVSVLMVLVSPTNYDYTLIVLYIPWALLLLVLSRPGCRIPPTVASWLMVCCAIIFTSQFYMLLGLSLSIGAVLKTLALCVILVVSAVYSLPANTLDEIRNQ